jgi:hypothetical protein
MRWLSRRPILRHNDTGGRFGGSAIAVASLVSSGWGAALAVQAATILATIGYYVHGGRDSDFGATIGSQ